MSRSDSRQRAPCFTCLSFFVAPIGHAVLERRVMRQRNVSRQPRLIGITKDPIYAKIEALVRRDARNSAATNKAVAAIRHEADARPEDRSIARPEQDTPGWAGCRYRVGHKTFPVRQMTESWICVARATALLRCSNIAETYTAHIRSFTVKRPVHRFPAVPSISHQVCHIAI